MVDDNTSPTEADLTLVADWLDARREALATRDLSLVRHQVDEFMVQHAIDPGQRIELALGLLQVEIQYLETARERVLRGVSAPIAFQPAHIPSPAVPLGVPTGPKLSELLPTFIDVMKKDAGWRGQTLLKNNGTYRLLLQRCGDLPVGA